MMDRLDKKLLIVIAVAFVIFPLLALMLGGPTGFLSQLVAMTISYFVSVIMVLIALFLIAALFQTGFGTLKSAVIRLAALNAIIEISSLGLVLVVGLAGSFLGGSFWGSIGTSLIALIGLIFILLMTFQLFAYFFDLDFIPAVMTCLAIPIINLSILFFFVAVLRQVVKAMF